MLQLYETLAAWPLCHAHAPTVRELAAACGLTHNKVWRGLLALRAARLVSWERGKARTVRVTNGRTNTRT